jgi:hypothetical protein
MIKILAKSEKGEGLLPMKEGKSKEEKKSEERKNIETCNFIKNAFCCSGEVQMVYSEIPISTKLFFRCLDNTRGEFWVAYGNCGEEK